jgi:DNA-binding response OmpR family regulator
MDYTSNNWIMIVGGDSHFSYLMQRYVKKCAHKIIIVNLGEDLLDLARCKKPVAIVLEVDQSAPIGWHTLQKIKTDPEVGRIPVIVCSWLNEEVRGLAMGADIYLRMPILFADFKAALVSILTKE